MDEMQEVIWRLHKSPRLTVPACYVSRIDADIQHAESEDIDPISRRAHSVRREPSVRREHPDHEMHVQKERTQTTVTGRDSWRGAFSTRPGEFGALAHVETSFSTSRSRAKSSRRARWGPAASTARP